MKQPIGNVPTVLLADIRHFEAMAVLDIVQPTTDRSNVIFGVCSRLGPVYTE